MHTCSFSSRNACFSSAEVVPQLFFSSISHPPAHPWGPPHGRPKKTPKSPPGGTFRHLFCRGSDSRVFTPSLSSIWRASYCNPLCSLIIWRASDCNPLLFSSIWRASDCNPLFFSSICRANDCDPLFSHAICQCLSILPAFPREIRVFQAQA